MRGMEERRSNAVPILAAIVMLLLPVLYVGSYLALVTPDHRDPFAYPYRVQNRLVEFYWPLEWIDRRVRPATWQLPPPVLPQPK
jgi:hypothetical protein